jgi:hypothetical protein
MVSCIVFLYTNLNGNAMAGEKSIPMSFRVSPRFRELLEAASARENRSFTNMLETLLFAYCEQHGLTEIAEPEPAPKNNNIGANK